MSPDGDIRSSSSGGTNADNPHGQTDPTADSRANVSLASCRQSLRAAVRLLAGGQMPQDAATASDEPGRASSQIEPTPNLVEEFRRAEAAYDELLVSISHDVKTALTVIRGHAQLTARAIRRGDTPNPETILAAMALIDASAVRIAQDLDGLLDDIFSDRSAELPDPSPQDEP